MPGFDSTGPWGRGPGTGWGRGPCGAALRRQRGRGRPFGGGGRGRGLIMGPWGRPQWGYGPWWFGFFGPAGKGGRPGLPRMRPRPPQKRNLFETRT